MELLRLEISLQVRGEFVLKNRSILSVYEELISKSVEVSAKDPAMNRAIIWLKLIGG